MKSLLDFILAKVFFKVLLVGSFSNSFCTLRISFSPYMTEEEFAYAYKRFKEVLIELNELS